MLTTRETRVISSKCIVLDPDSEPDIKRRSSLLTSSGQKKLSPENFQDPVMEITDYYSSLTGNDGSTKRTTLCNPTGSSLTRKSLNGVAEYNAGSHSCLHKYANRLKPTGRLSQIISQAKRGCRLCPKSMDSLIADNLSKKYITSKDSYNLKVVNDIIYNETSHIVAVFKEFLIYDDVSEFLRRFYKNGESAVRLQKVNDYYSKYSKVFPNYFLFKESKYMFKNIKRKQKWIDEQQRINAEGQQRPSKLSEDYEDKLFTTNCMDEINKTDSILGQSQRYVEPKEPEAKIHSYLKSHESIKCGHNKNYMEKSKKVEDMGLQELVDKFILKDSISVINISTAMAEPVVKKPEPQKMVRPKESQSRPTSRPRNLPSKEAWMESKDHNVSTHRTAGARASSVALANFPKQLASTSKHNGGHAIADLSTEKSSIVRAKSQEKAVHALVQKKVREEQIALNIKIPSTTNSNSNTGMKRSRSNTNAKAITTHSRNHMDKQGPKGYGTNAGSGRTCSKPVDGLATARSASHKEPIPRGKTTSQTPRPTTQKPSIASHTTRHTMGKPQPQNNIQKAINCFLSKGNAGVGLRASHDLSRDGSKLRNLKGVAIDLEATNQKLQKHAAVVTHNEKVVASGQTPGHGRRYKSDYLNSLMNNQNVPITTTGQTKGKVDLRTPPDLISRLSVPLSSGLRPESALGYNSATHSRPTLAVRDDNKKSTGVAIKSTGKVQMGRTSGLGMGSSRGTSRGQSRVPCV